ncbi:hypothetical protein PLESTM_000144400 [Pleodorina starrii]|nr:hypothetical protein PLESTM_000144400 [Pleodorina starrii]
MSFILSGSMTHTRARRGVALRCICGDQEYGSTVIRSTQVRYTLFTADVCVRSVSAVSAKGPAVAPRSFCLLLSAQHPLLLWEMRRRLIVGADSLSLSARAATCALYGIYTHR